MVYDLFLTDKDKTYKWFEIPGDLAQDIKVIIMCWKFMKQLSAIQFHFSSIVYGLNAVLWFQIYRIRKYSENSGFQLRVRIYTIPNGKQRWYEQRRQWHYWSPSTYVCMCLKSIAVRTDHKRAKKIETYFIL